MFWGLLSLKKGDLVIVLCVCVGNLLITTCLKKEQPKCMHWAGIVYRSVVNFGGIWKSEVEHTKPELDVFKMALMIIFKLFTLNSLLGYSWSCQKNL